MSAGDLKGGAQQAGRLAQVVLAVLGFLEKLAVPLVMWLLELVRARQRTAESKVAYYEAKERADADKAKVDEKVAGKSSRRVILDFLGRKEPNGDPGKGGPGSAG